MNYPAELIMRLGHTSNGVFYINYANNEINIVNGDNVTSIKIGSTINYCVLHKDYIYYSTSVVNNSTGISIRKICISTQNETILFTGHEEIYGELDVLDTVMGTLIVSDNNVYTESGEHLPIFIDGRLEDGSSIVHHDDKIIISMNIFSEKTESVEVMRGQFAIFSFVTRKRIFTSPILILASVREDKLESECESIIYEVAQKRLKKSIRRFRKRITVLSDSRIILNGDLIQLNHHAAEIPICYICEDEIYIQPKFKLYICSHPYLAHTECIIKTKCCPLCRETKRC
jgi:hypothetical protein